MTPPSDKQLSAIADCMNGHRTSVESALMILGLDEQGWSEHAVQAMLLGRWLEICPECGRWVEANELIPLAHLAGGVCCSFCIEE